MEFKHGQLVPVEKFTERTYDPKTGWRASREFEGELDHIQAMANAYVRSAPQFVRVQVTPTEAGLGVLKVTFDGIADGSKPTQQSNGEPVADTDQFTLQGSDYEKDVWSAPALVNLSSTYPLDYNWLRKNIPIIKQNGTWQEVIDQWNNFTWQNSATTLSLLKMFRDGVEAYTISQFVLRRSRGISSAAQGKISTANVGKTFSLNGLQTYEGVPSSFSWSMPTGGGWLKRTPSITYDNVTGKAQVDQEWWHAEAADGSNGWNSILYPFLG